MKHVSLKRILTAVVLLALLLPARADAAGDCSAKAMILYEPRTGTVLRRRNADERMLIASTTKIMTALIALERCRLSETVTVAASQTGIEGSSVGLREGEEYTVEELLYGLMLASGNDAAAALAEHIGGSIEGFAALMNAKARALGLENTHFANPHGLDDPEHYSSARDLALLTAAAMEIPAFCRLFSAEEYELRGVNVRNHNRLLTEYDGCIGGKTGYTRAAGRTLVSCAQRDGLRLICVTLSDPDDWADHAALYDAAFAEYSFLTFPTSELRELPLISGTVSAVPLQCSVPCALVKDRGEAQIHISAPRFVFAPVRRGEVLGTLNVTCRGKVLLRAELSAAIDAPVDDAQRLLPWERFLRSRAAAAARPSGGEGFV